MSFKFLTQKRIPDILEEIQESPPILIPTITTPITVKSEREYKGVFYNKNNSVLPINDSLRGSSVFLILGGPSLKLVLQEKIKMFGREYTGKEILQMPGFLTMSVNNTPRSVRTNLWTCVDSPSHFMKSIWLDPKIQKIIPIGKKEKYVFDNETWSFTDIKVKDCPNTFYFKLNNTFDPTTFLKLDTFNWGNDSKTPCALGIKGKRSVMLSAIRILFELGVKNVYLLGCDFKMDEAQPYHFDEHKKAGAVKANNNTYDALNKRFAALQGQFLENDFNIFNCNPESNLTVFPFKSFSTAITEAMHNIPDIETEKTDGLYNRSDNDEEGELKDYIQNKTIKYNDIAAQPDQRGILYFNSGTKCLARLLTSIHSLRKVYTGNICIASMGEESHVICQNICKQYNCTLKEIPKELMMNKQYWYEKSRMNIHTPFNTTLFLDADTIVQKDPSELFSIIEEHHFIVPQFANWTTQTGTIQKRLRMWESVDKQLVDDCITANVPSVNVGVFGFTKNSEFMKHWFTLTHKLQTGVVLPEETTCHLLSIVYKNKIIDSIYNYSCKHDKKSVKDAVIIHYHGNKHCRLENGKVLFNGDIWLQQWNELYEKNICDIKSWYDKIGDGKLKGYMSDYKK